MANEKYLATVHDAAEGGLGWSTSTFKILLATSAYTPDTSASGDHYVSDIPGAAIIARSAALTSKTNVGGTLDFGVATCSLVPSGSTIVYAILYKDTGVDATSPLLAKYDTGNGFPLDTDDQDVNIQTGPGPNFALTL